MNPSVAIQIAFLVIIACFLLAVLILGVLPDIRRHIWCKRHGLKLRKWADCFGSTYWGGIDKTGRVYAEGDDGEPREVHL